MSLDLFLGMCIGGGFGWWLGHAIATAHACRFALARANEDKRQLGEIAQGLSAANAKIEDEKRHLANTCGLMHDALAEQDEEIEDLRENQGWTPERN